jgi:sporulation protein YlmC with PRC-barrel domain
MGEITLVLGGDVRCAGSPEVCGELKSVVVDAKSGEATHLVVEPKDREGLARLVPLGEITGAVEGSIRLRRTEKEFRDLPAAEETVAEFVPGYGEVQLLPSGEGWRPADDGDEVVDGRDFQQIDVIEEIDLVPERLGPIEDEQEEHGGDRVHATDGDIGKLRALGVDQDTGKVTCVLLKEHLWGSMEVQIPAGDVSGFRDGIQLSITKQQVEDRHVGTDQPRE